MAHSFVQAYNREMDAFRDFARLYPQTILLIDTYDTLEAVEKIIQLSGEMGEEFNIKGVRIDSSNLATLATKVRQRLDSAGLEHVNIFASGGLDEYRIADLLEQNAPIDGFGVGTKMGVSDDVPYLDLVYKLTSYASRDRMKRSTGKETLPGQKQIFRQESDGFFSRDILSNFGEEQQGRALLNKVMENGKRTGPINRDIAGIREDTALEINKMPAEILDIRSKIREDPVVISEKLRERHENLVREIIN